MKGLLFKPWKVNFIAEHPDMETVTRRVINIDHLGWEYMNVAVNHEYGFRHKDSKEIITIKPRYQVGEVVYIKEACCTECYEIDGVEDACYKTDEDTGEAISIDCLQVKWRSPLFMPAWAARDFVKILDVRAEILRLPLSLGELELEGGEKELEMLEKIDRLWVFRYLFKLTDRVEE